MMTTGRHPFKGENPGATVRNICAAEPSRPTEIVNDYPPALEGAVMKALAKSPEERWSDAGPQIDHVLVRGAATSAVRVWPDEARMHDGKLLSDHAPVEVDILTAKAV